MDGISDAPPLVHRACLDLVAGPIGHWPLDEASGSTITDTVVSAHPGVTSATRTAGRFGRALSFDGAQYGRINGVPFKSTSGGVNTIAFWMLWNGREGDIPISLYVRRAWKCDASQF